MELKKLIVDELTKNYSDVDRCVVVNYTGISSEAAVGIRAELRKHSIELAVVKNSLMARAFANVGLASVAGLLDGPCAVATGGEDLVELSKVLSDVADKEQKLVIRGGYGDGQLLQADDVRRVATIPPKPVLTAQLLSVASRPLTSMLGAMGTFTRNFVGVLDAIAKKG
jgi:large subunit ribosomal protein L10